MKVFARIAVLTVLLAVAAPASTLAGGPTNGRVDVLWWDQDFEVRGGGFAGEESADDLAYRGEVFWGRYGVTAGLYTSDLDDAGDVDYLNADFIWKAMAPGGDAYLGVGGGWQQVDLGIDGLDGDADGLRVTVQGQVAWLYGRASWMPDLGDFEDSGLRLNDIEGREWEVGLQFNVLSKLRASVGWRSFELDFDAEAGGSGLAIDTESSGWIAGLGFFF